jgi:hypothetical protein
LANTLIDWVEAHERAWGNGKYTARPALSAILSAAVVVFWHHHDAKVKHYTITLNNDLSEMEKYFARMLFIAVEDTPARQVAAIFQAGRRMRVTGVHITFAPGE